MRIALDAMGTDNHPTPDVAGAVLAARNFKVEVVLVGDENAVRQELQKHNVKGLSIDVVHAAEHITMTDKPAEVGKGKPQSSMHIGMQLVRDGAADGFVTAGNTGGALVVATLHSLGRIKGIRRPAISAVGELGGNLVTIVDIGANTDAKVDWLKQFALMGEIYARRVLRVENPRVGLLANGSEDGKGDQLVREANEAFRELPLNFIGNVEPSDLLSGSVDVIITDGYVGNIMLKTYEAAISTVFELMRSELTQDLRGKIGAALARPYLKEVARLMDPTQYGGAPLLGVNGVVVITHGSSDAIAIRNSIQQAIRACEADVIQKIRDGLSQE